MADKLFAELDENLQQSNEEKEYPDWQDREIRKELFKEI